MESTEARVGTSEQDFIHCVARADDNDLGYVRKWRKGLCPVVVACYRDEQILKDAEI